MEGMTKMYYVPHTSFMFRNHQGDWQQITEALLNGIKREASAVDLYSRLANIAPNQQHQRSILYTLEDKKLHLKQFHDLYINLTGTHPLYQVGKVTFQTYRDGLQKAYKAELAGYEDYRKSCILTQYSFVQDVFLRAFTNEQVHATRMSSLYDDSVHGVKDYGGKPFVVNIEDATKENKNYRAALWTGSHLQVTLMSIEVGGDIGLEVHPTVDQFLRIEEGKGLVKMGDSKNNLAFQEKVYDDFAIVIPAGKWHNLINTGEKPLKLYSIYAPPNHPFGTVHETKEIAMDAEKNIGH